MLFFFTALASAEGDDSATQKEKAEKYAQKIIEQCWSISETERSQPNTQTINSGHEKTAQCLQDNYIEIYNLVAKRKLSTSELERKFKSLRDPYIDLYWETTEIYCDICGTMTSNIVLAQYANLLDEILSDLIYNVYINDLEYLLKP